MIIKKSPADLEAMRRSGRALAEVFEELEEEIRPGASLQQINDFADAAIRRRGGVPSFLGYRGYPASICASVDEVLVHGIPDGRVLEEGEIVSVDMGLILDGWHSDRARTYTLGEVPDKIQLLLEVTERSLQAAVKQCRPGNRLGDLGHSVQELVEEAGFSVAREYSGHGIGRAMHEDPQVPNYGEPGRGLLIEEGMVFALEPMVIMGEWRTKVMEDGWTVVTADGSLAAHFEETVAVGKEDPRVLTAL